MEVLSQFLETDELQLIRLLLADTQSCIRLEDCLSEWFETTIGTPQGDGLSPILFIIYLEAVLRDLYSVVAVEHDIVYADDTDFIVFSEEMITNLQEKAPLVFSKWSLQMNTSKTEILKISNPQHISSKALYSKTGLKPLRFAIFKARWRLFFKVLNFEDDVPAYQWTKSYFDSSDLEKHRGRSKTTLPVVLNKDLQMINRSLKSLDDLLNLRKVARDYPAAWNQLVKHMESKISLEI